MVFRMKQGVDGVWAAMDIEPDPTPSREWVARRFGSDREVWRGQAQGAVHAGLRCADALTRGVRVADVEEDDVRGFVVVRSWRVTDEGEGSERLYYVQCEAADGNG